MAGQRIAYRRVSTTDQNTARQLADSGVTFDTEFEDHATGANTDRPGLDALRKHARAGDVVHIQSLDRLGRSLVDLHQLIDELVGKGVTVKFHDGHMTFAPGSESPMNALMLGILGSVAQFERACIRERQAQGIAQAKARGVYKGRKPSLSVEHLAQLKARRATGESATALAREFGVSRQHVYALTKCLEKPDDSE